MSEKREPRIGSSQQAKENKCASDLLCLDTFSFAHMQSHEHASPCDIYPCMTEHMHLCSRCSEVHWLTARLKLFQETATCRSRSRILSSPCWWLFFPEHLNHDSGAALSTLDWGRIWNFQCRTLDPWVTVMFPNKTKCDSALLKANAGGVQAVAGM